MPDSGKNILVVDDEELFLRTTKAMLLRGGYSPIAASGGLDGLEMSRDFKGEIHLLLTDVIMPEMSGLTLAQQVIAARQNTRVLLMSACISVPSRLPLLRKPFRLAQLLEQVSNVMAGPLPVAADVFAGQTPSDVSLRSALTQEADWALRNYLEASRQAHAITKDVPSDIPGPDGVTQIENQAKSLKPAFAEYQRVRKRLDEHIAGEIDR
jgi:hypothetical protein